MSSPPPLSSLLEYQQRLHVDCGRCGRKLVYRPEEAIETFGAAMTVPRLVRILKCSACGASGRSREISVYPNTNDYYAAMDRLSYERAVTDYGREQADHLWAQRGLNTLRQ